MCVPMVDPAMGTFKIEEIPTTVNTNKNVHTNKVFVKTSAQKSWLICKASLSHSPNPGKVTLCYAM